jgi:hypothetical protein
MIELNKSKFVNIIKDLNNDQFRLLLDCMQEKDVILFLHEIKSEEILKKMQKYVKERKVNTLAQQIDDLATQFNVEIDAKKRLKILNKRDKLIKKESDDHDYYNNLVKELDRINKLIE